MNASRSLRLRVGVAAAFLILLGFTFAYLDRESLPARVQDAYDSCAKQGHVACLRAFKLCRARVNDTQALYGAATCGRLAATTFLIDNGAAVNGQPFKVGSTALMMAAGGGHDQVVLLLLSRGADPALAGGEGNALDAAIWERHESTAAILRAAGVRPTRPPPPFGIH